MTLQNFLIECYGLSNIGLIREKNEDRWLELQEQKCVMLADGMGGHKAGEIAAEQTLAQLSLLVSDVLKRHPDVPPKNTFIAQLQECITSANRHVYNLSQKHPQFRGMGTTLCLTVMLGQSLIFAHVGDSRIYKVSKKKMERLTRDHSLKDELLSKGQLSQEKLERFSMKNVITRAIGTQSQVLADIQSIEVETGDIYFLCSDGLTDVLTDEKILKIILAAPSLESTVKNLIDHANRGGGPDNITVAMFKII